MADATAQLARETNASVAVVSVDELKTELLSTLPRSEHLKRADEAATAALERLKAGGVPASKHVRRGPALEGILEFADEQDGDVIVLGPSTRSRLAQRLLGSVQLGLIQPSTRPVLSSPTGASSVDSERQRGRRGVRRSRTALCAATRPSRPRKRVVGRAHSAPG